jgi:hypothetical protein
MGSVTVPEGRISAMFSTSAGNVEQESVSMEKMY